MAMTRVERHSIADQLADQLRASILRGTSAPGSFLPSERELAHQAGVNRQAVREAIQQLRQQRLVEVVHGGGARVLDWTNEAHLSVLLDALVTPDGGVDPTLTAQVLRLRLVVLADAARAAAANRPPAGVAALRAIVDEMHAEAPDAPPRPRSDYWDEVVEMSDNVAYRLIYNSEQRVVARLSPVVAASLAPGWRSLDDYRRLTDAIAAGDLDAAEAMTRRILGLILELLEGVG